MAQTFAAKVDAWTRETPERIEAVLKTAVQYTFEDVLDATPRDTGFLAASWRASLTAPQRLTQKNPGAGAFVPEPYKLVIVGLEEGGTIYGSFGAVYAGYVEFGSNGKPGRGMVRLAAQNWGNSVQRAINKVKTGVG